MQRDVSPNSVIFALSERAKHTQTPPGFGLFATTSHGRPLNQPCPQPDSSPKEVAFWRLLAEHRGTGQTSAGTSNLVRQTSDTTTPNGTVPTMTATSLAGILNIQSIFAHEVALQHTQTQTPEHRTSVRLDSSGRLADAATTTFLGWSEGTHLLVTTTKRGLHIAPAPNPENEKRKPVTVGERGRIGIPKIYRDLHHLRAGDQVVLVAKDNALLVLSLTDMIASYLNA